VREERIHIFYMRVPIEFGLLGEGLPASSH
jgi:hypothetical protein